MTKHFKKSLRIGLLSLIVAVSLTIGIGAPTASAAGPVFVPGGPVGGGPPIDTGAPAPSAGPCFHDTNVDVKKSQCDLVAKYLNPAINLFSVSFGLIAIISIIMGSINYAMSEGDPQKASQAKRRITNTIFAVIAYIFLFAFIQFLIPGGAFK